MNASIVVPVFNEAESLPELLEAITQNMPPSWDYEVIFVDDGSTDASREVITKLQGSAKNVQLLCLGGRCGKSAAWQKGFGAARGDVVVTIDADLQNDPKDIPILVAKLNEGWDCVGGWRNTRQDPARRGIVSRAANRTIDILCGVGFHDLGCGLKAFKKNALTGLKLFKGSHRYILILLHRRGARVTEIPIRHHPRRHGRSKYRFRLFETGWVLLRILFGGSAGRG